MKQFYTICLLALLSITASGQTPQVTTDKRFVRGATMAFGRISRVSINGGSSLQKRGFCLSEKPVPTIGDTISTKTLDNNGTIYYFENLKPATKYYMRAYATNKDGLTGYGDVIKFYTLPKGNVSYTLRSGDENGSRARIDAAAAEACKYYNNMTSTTRRFNIGYESGTQTADCNYQAEPWMRVGPNQAYQKTGTIMHEMMHGLGLQNYSTQWCGSILRSGNGTGQWLGDRVAEALTFWENAETKLNGDNIHMWPYGINGAHEDDGTVKLYLANAMICQALGEDGLEHNESRHADPYYSLEQEDTIKYYIKNESVERGLYTSYLKPTATGALKWVTMTLEEAVGNDSTAWYITFTPQNQYYQLRNAATGQYLTYSSSTIKTASKTNLTANENWHLMKGRANVDGQRGYWVIHPEQNWTPKCLQASVNGNTTAATFNIANSAETQRWLIMTIDEAQVAETKAVAQVKKQAENALAQVKKLLKVAHTEDVTGADDALTTALGTIETQLASATTIPQLLAMIAETETAGMTFLGGVTPTGTPFDLTYKLVNPTIDENSDGWNGSPAIDYGCGEFYQNTFDFNQTVKDLPAGTYVFSAQAFQRPGPYSSAASVAVNATIYAGSQSQKLKHIKDGSQSRKVGTGREQSMDGKYIPDNMQAAAAYFKKGYYENRLVSTLATQGGSLKVGIKSTSMPSSYWAIFDTFRLYFYGSKTAEDVTAVKGVVESGESGSRQVFDLQGRRVSTPTKGLYIINGKKVLIK